MVLPSNKDNTNCSIQPDLLDGLESRMVIPLRSMDHFPNVKLPVRLTPVITIDGKEYLLEVPKMGAVPKRNLENPVTSLL
jgi:toxin CcdB